jgi:hypothetical protein
LRRVPSGFGCALKVIYQADDFTPKSGQVFYVHSHPATVFQDTPLDTFARSSEEHIKPALLSGAPDIGRFTAQSGFIEISLRHGGYYILQVLTAYARILLHVELITARTEKWATPTFLLVI